MCRIVSLIAFLKQPHGGIPHPRRRVLPQLGRDDLMDLEMQARVHRPTRVFDLAPPLFQCFLDLGMLVTDHERAHVGAGTAAALLLAGFRDLANTDCVDLGRDPLERDVRTIRATEGRRGRSWMLGGTQRFCAAGGHGRER
jgi:hypothetical protein